MALTTMDLWLGDVLEHSIFILVIFHLSHFKLAGGQGAIICLIKISILLATMYPGKQKGTSEPNLNRNLVSLSTNCIPIPQVALMIS